MSKTNISMKEDYLVSRYMLQKPAPLSSPKTERARVTDNLTFSNFLKSRSARNLASIGRASPTKPLHVGNTSSDHSNPSPSSSNILNRSLKQENTPKVSNVHDLEQIRSTLEQLTNLSDKIKVIDQVIDGRKELRQLSNQLQLKSAAPIIKTYVQKFNKKRQLKLAEEGNLNESPTNLQVPGTRAAISSYMTLSGSITDRNFDESPTLSKNVSLKNADYSSKEEFDDMMSACVNNLTEKIPKAAFSRRKKGILEVNLDTTKFANRKQREDHEARIFNDRERKHHRTAVRERGIKLVEQTFRIGSESLENDLYKFLVKNGSDVASKEMLLNSANSKLTSIQRLQSRVEQKYEDYVELRNKLCLRESPKRPTGNGSSFLRSPRNHSKEGLKGALHTERSRGSIKSKRYFSC